MQCILTLKTGEILTPLSFIDYSLYTAAKLKLADIRMLCQIKTKDIGLI